MRIGAQLYTVREFAKTAEELDITLKKVAEIGYKAVQVSGLGPIPAKTIKETADKYNLEIVVTHTNPDKLLNETEDVINDHKIMGAKYIGIGSAPEKYRGSKEGILQFIDTYRPVAKKIKEARLMFMYHNHDFEYEKFDGKLFIDYLVEAFEPDEMGFILDLYWIQAGGADPDVWIEKLAGRVDTIHFKDVKMKARERRMCEILDGNLNWERIFRACEKASVKWAFVEQDTCYGEDPFECLKTSFENLKSRGYE